MLSTTHHDQLYPTKYENYRPQRSYIYKVMNEQTNERPNQKTIFPTTDTIVCKA